MCDTHCPISEEPWIVVSIQLGTHLKQDQEKENHGFLLLTSLK